MALRYWTGNATPTSSNWSYNTGGITNWGSASGVADNVAPPTSADDVIFDGAGVKGNANSTISASPTILSITFTSGYTGTVTMNAGISTNVAGNFTDNTAHNWVINSTSSAALTISAASTITSNGRTFPGNVTFAGANTKTLNGSWTITGALTVASLSSTVLNQTGTDTLSVNGITQLNSAVSGTAKIRITGGSVVSNSSSTITSNNIDLDGNITFPSGGSFYYNTGTLKYVSGTITTTNHTLFIPTGTATLDLSGMVWNAITTNNASSITIASLLRTTTLTNGGNFTFLGTIGFIVANFIRTQGASSPNTVTFTNSLTYTITNSLTIFNTTNLLTITFTSDSPTLRANLILSNGATCSVCANFTRINSSGGRTINTFNGTVTDCLNIRRFTDLQTIATSIVN